MAWRAPAVYHQKHSQLALTGPARWAHPIGKSALRRKLSYLARERNGQTCGRSGRSQRKHATHKNDLLWLGDGVVVLYGGAEYLRVTISRFTSSFLVGEPEP
jgi:hypothetical protein